MGGDIVRIWEGILSLEDRKMTHWVRKRYTLEHKGSSRQEEKEPGRTLGSYGTRRKFLHRNVKRGSIQVADW